MRSTTVSFWIAAAGRCIYVTADAQIDADRHRVDPCTGGAWTPRSGTGSICRIPQTRELLLAEVSGRNYVYHIPIDEKDVCGIRRKCERSMARFSAELSTGKLLEAYPSEIVIE